MTKQTVTYNHKEKLRNYVLFKNEHCSENDVKLCTSHRRRSLIIQVKIGILPLYVETGRFHNVKYEHRVCQICNNGKLEHELHFFYL